MSGVRVLRVIEYTYPSAEMALHDEAGWQMQGTHVLGHTGIRIDSTVVSRTSIEDTQGQGSGEGAPRE